MLMNQTEIMRIIPHRAPMLLVDTVEAMELGSSITTTFRISENLDIFRGHFPEGPVLPGVYAVESMAQTADILLLSTERYAGKIPLFLEINNVHFVRKILPGSTIEIQAVLMAESVEKAIATCSAKVFCQGILIAVGDVTLAMR